MANSTYQKRLFTGVPLPGFFKETLLEVQAANNHISTIRWTPPQNLHITLYFLGNKKASEIDEVISQLQGVAREAGPFTLNFDRYRLAPKKRPYMIWATFQPNATFTQLSRAIGAIFQSENNLKAPRAHITLARLKYVQNPSQIVLLSPINTPEIAVQQMTLWASALKPEGPKYTALHTFALGIE